MGMTVPSAPPAPSAPLAAMTDPGADWLLAQLREVLDLTCRAALRRLAPGFWRPWPGSAYAAELANTELDVHGAPWGPLQPTLAFEAPMLKLVPVEDYLTAIRKQLEPPFPPYVSKFGSAALCRSVLESAGSAFWLMDPQVSVRQRVARAHLIVWDEHETAVRNARKEGTPQQLTKAQADRDAHVARVANLGLPPTKVKNKLTVAGESLPTKTEAVTALLAGKVSSHTVVYSLYSAVAHGELTGILSRRLAGGWTITPRQLTQDVELAVVGFGQLQQRLCRGGMGSAPDPLENEFWERNVGRRLLAVRSRLA